jgi:hypothetical protein
MDGFIDRSDGRRLDCLPGEVPYLNCGVHVEEDRKREDEWFRQNEKQLLEAAKLARAKREKERADNESAAERKKLRDLHYMKCPKCGHDMKEEDQQTIKIDRCTHCEGVFFDAGELEQLFTKKSEERRGLFRRLAGI